MIHLVSIPRNLRYMHFFLFFLIEIFETIVGLHVVLRGNTERFLCTLCPVSLSGIILQNYNVTTGVLTLAQTVSLVQSSQSYLY